MKRKIFGIVGNAEKRGFTLVELLVVMVVLAVLAAVVLPKFVNSSTRAKEAELKTNLRLARDAIERFHNDVGLWPNGTDDLVNCPETALDNTGNDVNVNPSNWHGPYLESRPFDPIGYCYLGIDNTPPNMGKIYSEASGNGTDGKAYSSY